jgi:hypothetical protein
MLVKKCKGAISEMCFLLQKKSDMLNASTMLSEQFIHLKSVEVRLLALEKKLQAINEERRRLGKVTRKTQEPGTNPL